MFRFNLKQNYFLKWIKIIPDDKVLEMKINGVSLPISNIPENALKDYVKGFNYPIGDFLNEGENFFEIKVTNFGGDGKIKVQNTLKNVSLFLLFFILKTLFLLGCIFIIFSFDLPALTKIFLSLAIFLGIIYASFTKYDQRGYDAVAHIEYIEYISKNLISRK